MIKLDLMEKKLTLKLIKPLKLKNHNGLISKIGPLVLLVVVVELKLYIDFVKWVLMLNHVREKLS